jgi:catechol 2,3-dioxygenase-like lactoylglutathione lyase family enzyme
MPTLRPSAILETVIYVDDLTAAENFYAGVLGLSVYAHANARQIFLRCGNQMLLIFDPRQTAKVPAASGLPVPPHGASGPGHVCFAAATGEIDAWRDRLVQCGIKIEVDFEWPGGGRSIYVRDPAGNSVEFAEPRIWKLPGEH